MLDLNKILRANEINFAILTFLPAFALFLILGELIRRQLNNKVSNTLQSNFETYSVHCAIVLEFVSSSRPGV